MIRPARYVPEYDIPKQQFSQDLEYGQQGEMLARSFLASMSSGAFEVKTDRYRNGRMVVETDQNPFGKKDDAGNPIWVPSGINVTKATWWVYVFTLGEGFIAVDVQRLKRFLRRFPYKFNPNTKRSLGSAGDNPARGFLLMPNDVIDLLSNSDYDAPKGEQ